MDLIEAICNKRSVRSFKTNPVPKNVLENILDICAWTASAGNVQQ
ncbi:MAG: nitroreductase family protein [Dehalococcoidales bacterium]|nr:nitroreductase family protein [Dehalococcoidales bacterium]